MTRMREAHRIRNAQRWSLIIYAMFRSALPEMEAHDIAPVCPYCQLPTTWIAGSPDACQIDHVQARNGEVNQDNTNLIAACRDCNERKSDKPVDSFLPDWFLYAIGMTPDGFADWIHDYADQNEMMPDWIHDAAKYVVKNATKTRDRWQIAQVFAKYGFDWVQS